VNAADQKGRTALQIAKRYRHSEIIVEISKQLLQQYIAETNERVNDPERGEKHYLTSFTIFSHQINFGYSAGEKSSAASALQRVIQGEAGLNTLEEFRGALDNGRLGKIYYDIKENGGLTDQVQRQEVRNR